MRGNKELRKASEREPAAGPSILSSDLQIEGDIVSKGELHISGSVKGDVVARDLTLSEGGSVTGAVRAESAIIAGNVSGCLTATSVVLKSTACLTADVTHVSLIIEPGAAFDGISRRVNTVEIAADDGVHKLLPSPPGSNEAKPKQEM